MEFSTVEIFHLVISPEKTYKGQQGEGKDVLVDHNLKLPEDAQFVCTVEGQNVSGC